jgi:hypothetical protein
MAGRRRSFSTRWIIVVVFPRFIWITKINLPYRAFEIYGKSEKIQYAMPDDAKEWYEDYLKKKYYLKIKNGGSWLIEPPIFIVKVIENLRKWSNMWSKAKNGLVQPSKQGRTSPL